MVSDEDTGPWYLDGEGNVDKWRVVDDEDPYDYILDSYGRLIAMVSTSRFGNAYTEPIRAAPETAAERDALKAENEKLKEALSEAIEDLETFHKARWSEYEGSLDDLTGKAKALIKGH